MNLLQLLELSTGIIMLVGVSSYVIYQARSKK